MMTTRTIVRAACCSCAVAFLLQDVVDAQVDPMGGIGTSSVVRSTEVREFVPRWLELPRRARIRTGEDIRMTPLQNSGISMENLRIGILIGALRNEGPCTTDLNARLQYVDDDWQPIGPPIPNEARVSQVEPGGIFPYRFRLRNISKSEPSPAAYLVIIEQDDKPIAAPYTWKEWVSSRPAAIDTSACQPFDTRLGTAITRKAPQRQGYILQGTVTHEEGGPVRADGMVLTAVLRDSDDNLLEVMVGTPTFRARDVPDGVLRRGEQVNFRLRTDVPLGRSVEHIDITVELLPDARVEDAPPP